MHADEINGVTDDDDFIYAHDEAMTVMDRLLDFAPARATNLDRCLEAAPRTSSSAHGAITLRQRSENPDERRAYHALYGPRSGDVSPASPRRLKHTFCHCCTYNNDAAPAGASAGAAQPYGSEARRT